MRTNDESGIVDFRCRPEQWLWCLRCERFFQGRDAREDPVGAQGCAFADCDGASYRVDLFDWDAWPGDDPVVRARWPTARSLRKGLLAPAWAPGDEALPEAPAALNPNHWRRDAILGIVSSGDATGETPFQGLDLVGLATLLAERFLGPDGHEDGAPSPLECLAFMARWPEVRAHGYAVHPAREDYRVAIEGLACDLDGVSPTRRDALTEAFAIECCDARSFVSDARELFAAWG